jgi:pimeloyl-ACP methyl ester carboxylesterase
VYPAWLLVALRSFFGILSLVAPRLAGRVALRLFCTPQRHRVPGWEREIAAGGVRTIVGGRFAARSWGAGPIVLLIHGWEGRGTQLGRFVDPLVAAGFRVVAVDGPAHGESPGRRTDLIEFTEALRRIGRDLGPLAAIVAHSFGGATSTLAIERGLDVGAIVLIASPSSIDEVLAWFEELVGLGRRARRAFRDEIEYRTRVKIADVEIYERVSELRVPSLVVHDRDDREVPFRDAERLSSRWPGARLLATDGLGHRRILKDDRVIAAVVAFVSEKSEVRV